MTKIRNPLRFSEHFGIKPEAMDCAGVLNPTLNVDTPLFIDPLLLENSAHPEVAKGARSTYEQHFNTVIKLLSKTTATGDVPWRAAQRLLSFPEIKWTCLGYGAESVSGSGSGADMTNQYIETARQIVALGVDDPDLFVAMALFEKGVGPDRISDMTTNVILGDLLDFNRRILKELGIAGEPRQIGLRNGKTFDTSLPVNPCLTNGGPIILVPSDVLRDLPIVTDWSTLADAASKNEELRYRVNDQIAHLWEAKSRKGKDELRRWVMSGKGEFETFLDIVKGATLRPYDLQADPDGELFWRRLAETLPEQFPVEIGKSMPMDYSGVLSVVKQIIEQFRFLIEDRRFSEELYHNGTPRPEKAAQRLFFAVAYAYCKANHLDLTPEADTGNGPVDFKISRGFSGRVLVEIKLSRNSKVVAGYAKQLEAYKIAEETLQGYYVIVDVGQMGNKDERLIKIHNEAVKKGEQVSPIVFIDGSRRASASKL